MGKILTCYFILFHSFSAMLSNAHRVGITAAKLRSSTWAIVHHTLSMYDSMTLIEGWDPVLVVEGKNYKAPTETIYNVTYNVIPMSECRKVDTLIQSSFVATAKEQEDECPGVHHVYFNQAGSYFNIVENLFANKSTVSTSNEYVFDTIWNIPSYTWQGPFLKYWRGTPDTQLHECPYVWTPNVFESRFAGFRYEPGTANRVGVYETNRVIQKVSIIPMSVVEVANRAMAIDYAQIYGLGDLNTAAFKRDVLPRLDVNWFGHADLGVLPERWSTSRIGTVVSHQLHCGLNYLWLEALHAGMALIHNSEHIRECGYYYDGFNVTDGAEALNRAMASHDTDEDRKVRDQACLWRFSPSNPANVAWYKRLLDMTLLNRTTLRTYDGSE